jgi:twitching motility protein PilT
MKLEKIFQTAVKYGASDIYINVGVKPTLRINGKLIPIEEHPILSKTMAEDYLSEIMTSEQKQEFAKNLDLDFGMEVPGIARFRVNVFIQSKGIGGVLRIIPTDAQTIESLNLPEQIQKVTEFKQGIVLVTGPTGQGKSSTLASLIHEINLNKSYHIITIEDPIEFIHQNKKSIINQREVGTHTMSFKNALRGALREAVDVILIGELRDYETISLALTAAETGHLVLSTLHTSGAAKSVDRIIDSFPSDQQNQIRNQLSESLKAVLWQQLLPKADGNGRVPALEILFNNNAVSNLIRKNKTYQIQSVLETSMKDGMQTMETAINDLSSRGLITQETADNYLQGLFGSKLSDY